MDDRNAIQSDRIQSGTSDQQLPVVSDHVVRSLTEWLKGREQMQRPPEATAKVLAFIILAYDLRLPFPTRGRVALHLGVSIPAVDVVLSQRLGTRDITIVNRTRKGNVRQRVSTIKFRLVIPKNQEMIDVVHKAVEEDIAAQAAMKPKRRKNKDSVDA